MGPGRKLTKGGVDEGKPDFQQRRCPKRSNITPRGGGGGVERIGSVRKLHPVKHQVTPTVSKVGYKGVETKANENKAHRKKRKERRDSL